MLPIAPLISSIANKTAFLPLGDRFSVDAPTPPAGSGRPVTIPGR